MKFFITLLVLMMTLAGCAKEANDDPSLIAQEFWGAIQEGKMDSAKQMVSWDTVGYLKYIQPNNFTLKRVDFPAGVEASAENTNVDTDQLKNIITELVVARQGDHSDIRIPTRTVLKLDEGVWRVDLKETLVEVVNRSVNKVGDQLNKILQQGVAELNQALNGSINEISKSIEQGAKGFTDILQESLKEVESSLKKVQDDLKKDKSD
ncbi:MAG TPA: hypothetical protein EYH35_01960 [Thiotrichaceae bacterium]|nr:hypothetical protein [Thiotrichaceae bacterium]